VNDDQRDFEPQRGWLLHTKDQVYVAVLTTVCLALILGSWLYRGGISDRLIDIDRADPRPISFQLDINGAEWPEWTLLPGVGEVLAKRIVESRDSDGPFDDHADLLRVQGIGPRTLQRIEPYLMALPKTEAVAGP
jgi:competence protein ComEA